jgi:hypothetical protein
VESIPVDTAECSPKPRGTEMSSLGVGPVAPKLRFDSDCEWWPGAESNEDRNLLIFISNHSSENCGYPESYPGDFLVFSEPNHLPPKPILAPSARTSRNPFAPPLCMVRSPIYVATTKKTRS